jgi:hypothetical protein
MTRHACTLLLLISGLAATAPHDAPALGAAPKVEEGPGPYNIDLDVAAGDDEERFLQVPAGAFTVKGFIQFVRVRADPKWAPLAAIEVTGSKDSFYAGLIAFVLPKAPDKIEFAVRDERLHGLPNASFGRIHLTNQAIPFELRLDRSGVLQASVMGTPGRAVSVRPFEISRVRLLGSTAHVRFLNVELAVSDR